MDWLADNWMWVVGGVLVVAAVFVLIRSQVSSGSRRKGKRSELSDSEKKKLVKALVDALEGVVDDVIGRDYGRKDREKIAMGMIAVMAADDITLKQLTSNEALFAAVMLKSVKILSDKGIISKR
jgi:hypothetical protein